mmetsp:Transcript_20519/g.36817  ORF Transcript_20519/g.36817 Transcript_20519/m.36817 type:complete len:441 (+) Transcript_20519:3071-4393(+)
MRLGDEGHGIRIVVVLLHGIRILGLLPFPLNVLLDVFADRGLARALTDLGDVGAGESVGEAGEGVEIHVASHGRLAETGLEDLEPGFVIRQRNVDQLVQTTGAKESRVDDVGTVGGADDEDGLLGVHTVHLGQQLVEDTVRRATGVAGRTSTLHGDGIELVEKEDARSGAAGLVENLAHIRLALTEPHREQLRTLHTDEVRLALVCNGLCQKRFTATRRAIKQNAFARRHSKLFEFLRVLHRVLDEFLELAFDALQAPNILPADIGHLHHSLAKRRGIAHSQRSLEVVLSDGHRTEDFGVNFLVLQIDDIHFFTDALKRCFRAQSGQIGPYIAMGFFADGLQIHVLIKLHVLGVDPQHLQASGLIRDANIDLPVEATEASECRINAVGPVGGRHHDDMGSTLESIHEREQLRNNSPLYFALGLLALRRDRIYLINKNDRR